MSIISYYKQNFKIFWKTGETVLILTKVWEKLMFRKKKQKQKKTPGNKWVKDKVFLKKAQLH